MRSPRTRFTIGAAILCAMPFLWLLFKTNWPPYLIWLVVCNLITFAFYAVDKKQAQRGGWRIPEVVLFSLSLAGGFLGGFVAMKWMRHKTQHIWFWVVQVVGLVLHSLLVAAFVM